MTKDPDGGDKDDVLSQNPYAYAKGNPVRNVDPDGHMAFALAAAGFVITAPLWVPEVAIGAGIAVAGLAIVSAGVWAYNRYLSKKKGSSKKAKIRGARKIKRNIRDHINKGYEKCVPRLQNQLRNLENRGTNRLGQ